MRNAIIVLGCLVIAGCTPPPDLGIEAGDAGSDVEFPKLIPLVGTVLTPSLTSDALDFEPKTLADRAAALRARAAILRRPVVDEDTFQAMRAALARRGR